MIIASDKNIFKLNPFNETCTQKRLSFQDPYLGFFDDANDAVSKMHELLSLLRKNFKECQVSDQEEFRCLEDESLEIEKMNGAENEKIDEKEEPKAPILWFLYGMTSIVTTVLCIVGSKRCRDSMNNKSVADLGQEGEEIDLSIDLNAIFPGITENDLA